MFTRLLSYHDMNYITQIWEMTTLFIAYINSKTEKDDSLFPYSTPKIIHILGTSMIWYIAEAEAVMFIFSLWPRLNITYDNNSQGNDSISSKFLTLQMKGHLGIPTQKMGQGVDRWDEEAQSELPRLYSRQPPVIVIENM